MHLRSNKNSLFNKVVKTSSVKVHKKTTRKTPVKNIVKELKSNTNENVSYSIELDNLVKMIIIYNECILFLQKEYILKNQEKEDASRILNTIELTDFETMSFVCPELDFWKHQF